MKIKELLNPILEDLKKTIEKYGNDDYEYEGNEPHVELMLEDTYYDINDIYFIVEDDGDVVLRVNTDCLVEAQIEKCDDIYRFLYDIDKVMDKYDKTFAYHWDEKGIYIEYLD